MSAPIALSWKDQSGQSYLAFAYRVMDRLMNLQCYGRVEGGSRNAEVYLRTSWRNLYGCGRH